MGRDELVALVGARRNQLREPFLALELVDECLRRDIAAGEGDVDLAGVGLGVDFEARFLRRPWRHLARAVHEMRRHAIGELPLDVRDPREVDPAEGLERRFGARILLRRFARCNRLALAREVKPVLDRPEGRRFRPPVFDRKADEIVRRPPAPPVHRQQDHAFAAMDLERERSRGDRALDKGEAGHFESDLSIRPAGHSRSRHGRMPRAPAGNQCPDCPPPSAVPHRSPAARRYLGEWPA